LILLRRLYAHRFKQLDEVTLVFPVRGSILIEGSNEAGKSSLFEAVYFALYGQTLLADRDYKIESLRQYGAEEMKVELDFTIDDRPFSISRRLVGNHRARLECPAAGGKTEIITSLGEINRRLQSELHLTPDGLLNTCFVEQKQLERLEDLRPDQRQKAVNDLLNLRVLTGLEESFKIKKEDQIQVQELTRRVGVAGLDAELPTLDRDIRQAELALAYVWAEEAASLLTVIGEKLQCAADERGRICALLDAEQGRLRQAEQLRDCVRALDRTVSPAIEAWETALRLRQESAELVRALEDLAGGLPERDRALDGAAALLTQLESLERLRQENVRIVASLADVRNRLEDYDRLAEEWRAGEEGRLKLENERKLQLNTQREAEEDVRKREYDRRREAGLALLLGHDRARREALDEACRADEEHVGAIEIRETLPALEKRQQDLNRLEELVRGRDDQVRSLQRAEADLAAAREKLSKDQNDRAEALALDERLERLESDIAAGRETEQAAAELVNQRSLHQALSDWVEASDRLGEESRVEARALQLSTRQQSAEARRAAADEDLQRATRQQTPGFALVGAGIIIASLSAVTGHLIGIASAVILIPGAILIARARSAVSTARQALASAKAEAATLEGESRATRSQREEAAAQRARWTDRESACRKALQALLGPAARLELDEVRERIAAPPEIEPTVARERHEKARDALIHLTNQETLARGRRESLTFSADPQELARRVDEMESEMKRLETMAVESDMMPALLESLNLAAGRETITAAASTALDELADARAAAGSIPDLEARAKLWNVKAQSESNEVAVLAREVGLPGAGPEDWTAAAVEIKAAFAAAVEMVTDDSLRQGAEAARAAVSETDRTLAALGADQIRRRDLLDAVERENLVSAIAEEESARRANAGEQDLLAHVTPALQSQSLPLESGLLRTELEIRRAALRHDRGQADGLRAARSTLKKSEQDLESKEEAARARWKEALHDEPLPETAADGRDRIPVLREAAAADLNRLDEPALHAELRNLEQSIEVISRQIHNLEHDSGRALSDRDALREKLRRSLKADPGGAWESLPIVFPELKEVKTLVAEIPEPSWWEDTVRQRRDEKQANRTSRSTLANQFHFAEDPLDLPAEQEALTAAEQMLAVKRRAGEIVEKTRESIVNRVMPLTIRNMRQLLPLLTEGRYSESEWDESTNTISIYDNLARSYQRKRVFSGGARDQISLSLRLAFALATLPGEHNCRPGFLFLDEPLSSFDRPRTQALVDLLTRGLISRQFAQILLISHSESFNPDLFDYRIRMDGGRVVESTL